MLELRKCDACQCLVKTDAAACPFCGAEMPVAARTRVVARSRMSRGAWLVVGSSAVALGGGATFACSTSARTSQEVTAQQAGDAGDAGEQPTADGAITHVFFPGCRAGEGAFACGDAGFCRCSTEVCWLDDVKGTAVCGSFAGGVCTNQFGVASRCACFNADYGVIPGPPSCDDDDGGQITITNFSWGGCYGAPPARLERLARA